MEPEEEGGQATEDNRDKSDQQNQQRETNDPVKHHSDKMKGKNKKTPNCHNPNEFIPDTKQPLGHYKKKNN